MTLCCLCCKSGPISATLYLETIGFVPGEGIPIHVEIENRSGRKISAASVTLLMVNLYVSRHDVYSKKALIQWNASSNSFALLSCHSKNERFLWQFYVCFTGFSDNDTLLMNTLFIDVWKFTQGLRALVLSIRTIYEYWSPPLKMCIINPLHYFKMSTRNKTWINIF